jgi:SAM-dependent methyltransferase
MEGGGQSLDSIDYYNKYATVYFESTVNVDISDVRKQFEELLPEGGAVLDLGCGSGRDSLAFYEDEFDVTPLDGSAEMCALAEIHTDLEVLHMTFDELDFDEVFDGVWACASLLHVPEEDMPDILKKIGQALKPGGIFFVSVKEGDFEGSRNGRYFVDYSKNKLSELIEDTGVFEVKKVWRTDDVQGTMGDSKWLNLIAKKEYN